MSTVKDLIAVSKPKATGIGVAWENGAWSEFDVAGRRLNAYPPVEDSQGLVDWAVSVAKIGGSGRQEASG